MSRFLLLGCCGLLLSLVAYTSIVPAIAAAQDQYPDTPEGWAKLYEEQAQKCLEDAYNLNREIQKTRGEIIESQGAPMLVLAFTYFQRDYEKACRDYHFYSRQARWERAHIPTPTPTPTPIPIPTTSSPDPRDPRRMPSPSGTGTLPLWPRGENDLHVKFITEQKRKLRELKERGDKLIKEANDLLNKAKTTKTKPPTPGYKVEFDSTDGLITVKFSTPQGILRVNLPDDIRPGDKISGSLVAEPNGQIKTERAGNRAALNQYQVMIANSRPGANDFILRLFRKKPPATKPGTGSNLDRSEPCACPFEFTFSGSGGFVTIEQPQTAPVTAEPSTCVEAARPFSLMAAFWITSQATPRLWRRST